ncbi:hypothetical protein [Streptomyces sp. NPDC048445]|uniref:hypothetical protein n=1 Tax=Streptomyces sp. NPDC048445 TaxID=3365553 RepID=UPI003711E3E6
MPDLFRRGQPQPASGQINGISSGCPSAVIPGLAPGKLALRLTTMMAPLITLAFMAKASIEPKFACTLSGCAWDVSVHFRWLFGC